LAPYRDPSASDEELARAAQQGEVRALDTLIDRHQAKVLRVLGFLGVPGQDREDVAQEVFVRVFRHLKSFRARQSFGAWIYRVTVNAAHDYRTRHGRRMAGESGWDEGLEEAADPRPGPAESARERELRQALDQALETLTVRERSVFVLRELEGLETAVVARSLGISTITVRRHLFRARRRLREALASLEQKKPLAVERILPGGSSHG
jgi:RNA polymerase sigma-70 factor (ECF subfamily)